MILNSSSRADFDESPDHGRIEPSVLRLANIHTLKTRLWESLQDAAQPVKPTPHSIPVRHR